MAKKICEYCGEPYDDVYEGQLNNGCPACPDCVQKEEENEKRKEN